MTLSKQMNFFCWRFCNQYCGLGDEEDCKPSIMTDPTGTWHSESTISKEAAEHIERSSKIKELEECITENVRQRQDRRHRITVFAKQINVTDSCPKTYPKTEEEKQFLNAVLAEDKHCIFADFSDKERSLLIDIMEKDSSFRKGDLIYQVGDVGEYFYVIDHGQVDIMKGHKAGELKTETYRRGDSFGEIALLFEVPRQSTARARADCVLWRVHQKCFRERLAHNALNHEKEMMELLRGVPLFEKLEEGNLRKLANAFERIHFEADQPIVNKGDVGQVFYIIEAGQVRMHGFGMGDSQHVDQILSTGEWFGERSLMTGEPRTYNATAITQVSAWAVDKETFETSFGPVHRILEQQMRKSILVTIPIFAESNILSTELDALADKMVELCLRKGHQLDEVGKTYRQELIIVQDGNIAVYDGSGEDSKVFTLKSGDYYGDKHLKDNTPKLSDYNVVCEADTTCWVLSRDQVKEVIGDLKRLGRSVAYEHKRRVSSYTNGIFLKDLEQLKVLGHGGFGRVWLARHKKTGNYYALKALSKRRVLDKNQAKNVVREKNILSTINHPFILSQVSSFQDESFLYILMNLVQGGELYTLIVNTKGLGLPKASALFYSSCIYCALAHFHQRLIVYRDLKPENVMIDREGYCVLVDLGFAKVVTSKTYTLCGTPEYLAPEIFMSQGHDKAADYWSLGVLLFELMTGNNPFHVPGGKQIDMFKRIVKVEYNLPATVDGVASDLIQKLLVRNPAMRLGNLSDGPVGVREHSWFTDIDWKKLVKKEVPAPWIPEIKRGEAVTDSFYDNDSHAAYRDLNVTKPLSESEQLMFKDF